MQHLHARLTTWHITWGTRGARLHGDKRATVDKSHNQPGDPFIEFNEARLKSARDRMKLPAQRLTKSQRMFIEQVIPQIAERGKWQLRTCAAGPDHVHILLDVDPRIHGKKVRRLLKRWIGEALSERWPLPEGASWWAEEGSNKPVHDEGYLNNAYDYVEGQRASETATAAGAEDGPAR